MDSHTKYLLETANSFWPLVSGLAVTAYGAVRLMVFKRKERHNKDNAVHQRLTTLEQNTVTHDELDFCKNDLSNCIRAMQKDIEKKNTDEHREIRNKMDKMGDTLTDRLITHLDSRKA